MGENSVQFPKVAVLPVEQIDLLKPLWEELNRHHLERAKDFRGHFSTFTFEARKRRLLAEGSRLFIEVAVDEDQGSAVAGETVGYCISSICEKGTGEVESLYIRAPFRRMGIGDRFMKDAMQFFDKSGISDVSIKVAAGNEEAFAFYARYGFAPRIHVLSKRDP